MNKQAAAAAVIGLMTASISANEPFAIQGYEAGAPMSECPANTETTKIPRVPVFLCNLGPTTFGGHKVKELSLIVYDSHIAGVQVRFESKGDKSDLVDALTARYGAPSERRSSTHSRVWTQGDTALLLNDGDGSMTLLHKKMGLGMVGTIGKEVEKDR